MSLTALTSLPGRCCLELRLSFTACAYTLRGWRPWNHSPSSSVYQATLLHHRHQNQNERRRSLGAPGCGPADPHPPCSTVPPGRPENISMSTGAGAQCVLPVSMAERGAGPSLGASGAPGVKAPVQCQFKADQMGEKRHTFKGFSKMWLP